MAVFYSTRFYGKNDNTTVILNDDWNAVDLGAYLDKVDFVIIEVNESAISNYSNGFAAYLATYLDGYVPKEADDNSYVRKLDCNDENAKDLSTSRGYHGMEEGFVWVPSESVISLENELITQNGLCIKGMLNDDVAENDRINVYVNGKKVYTNSTGSAGEFVINIPAEEIASEENKYKIELFFSNSIVPSELGISDDTRELAARIVYVGEL